MALMGAEARSTDKEEGIEVMLVGVSRLYIGVFTGLLELVN